MSGTVMELSARVLERYEVESEITTEILPLPSSYIR
jgi:hypothetical protein